MGTDKDWEKWGASDAYFGVYSDEKYRRDHLTEGSLDEFFQSGETHIENLISNIDKFFDTGFQPKTGLDFGSGVGRMVIPMARRMKQVTGVDISPSMIAEAKRNCERFGIENVKFLSADDGLSAVEQNFDFVHSHIVLPHIRWIRGRTIIQSLAKHVSPGGCLVVQILTEWNASPLVKALVGLRYRFPPANWVRNLFRSRPPFEPAMQLHLYDADAVTADLHDLGFAQIERISEQWNKYKSVIVYAKRRT